MHETCHLCVLSDVSKTGFSGKLLPRLDLLSIMPLTVQKVLIQNIVGVIKWALRLDIQLYDQFWYLVNTVGKINQELATVAETIAMSLFDDWINEKTKDLYETMLSIFNQIETKTQIQTTRVNSMNFWPNIIEQESYPATKSNPNLPADKASRMPHAMGTKLGSDHCHTSHRNRPESVVLTFSIMYCFELCEEEYWPTTSSTRGSLTTKIDNMTDLNYWVVLPEMSSQYNCFM